MKKVLCLTAVLLLAGGARAADVTANDLKQIGLAYHNFNDATNKAPAKAKDLAPYFENSKKLLNFLESGQIVFLYNVRLQQIIGGGAGTSNTVLAYVKDVPTKGGWVLMADASVKKMTADEFKKAPKAGKK
jgi:hypothetical protein